MLPRPGLPSFDYVRASTSDEVLGFLAEHGEAARLLMGGTDLLVLMRDGAVRPRVVVDVKHLPWMRVVSYAHPAIETFCCPYYKQKYAALCLSSFSPRRKSLGDRQRQCKHKCCACWV